MLNSRFAAILRRLPVPDSVMDYFLHKLFETHRLDHEKFGLKPKHGLFSAHLTVNDELPNRLCCGSIRVRPNIRQFTQNGVIFEDGTLLEGVDQVILATGYTFEFPLLEAGRLLPVQENDVSLFLNIFPPALHSHNTLGIIGLIQPLGSIMPIAEMQARLFFSAFTGAIQMPSCTDMEAHAAGVKEAMHAQFVQSRRHTIQVILATGYTFEFPLLEAGKLLPVQENDVSLFLNIFPPALHSHNTLGIIGLIQPLGSIMPIAEMQARLFFSAFTGAIQMPSCTDMEAHAAGVKEAMHAQFVQSRRHTIQVDYIEYMDTLAELIGCVPRLGRYLFNDPALLKALLFGPNLSYAYRLDGPGQWSGARQAILTLRQRVEAGMRGIKLPEDKLLLCPEATKIAGILPKSAKRQLPAELIRAFFAFMFSVLALAFTVWVARF
uniref:Flavin-containing monooxygenase n=1 Tax=Globodera pallida TaxID=36090 RepID=A0A183C6X5_GLOPA